MNEKTIGAVLGGILLGAIVAFVVGCIGYFVLEGAGSIVSSIMLTYDSSTYSDEVFWNLVAFLNLLVSLSVGIAAAILMFGVIVDSD